MLLDEIIKTAAPLFFGVLAIYLYFAERLREIQRDLSRLEEKREYIPPPRDVITDHRLGRLGEPTSTRKKS